MHCVAVKDLALRFMAQSFGGEQIAAVKWADSFQQLC